MIVLPEQRVIVVATPRTASRAVNKAIEMAKPGGLVKTRQHHDWPHEVERAAKNGGYEVWTMIREPISQLKSWISHCGYWHDPTDFIQTYKSRYFFYQGGMNIYNKEATRFFIYEQDGMRKMLEELGLMRDDNDVYIPVVGETGSKERNLTPTQVDLAKQRFDKDFRLYNKQWEEQN